MASYLKLSVCLTATLTAAALAQSTDQPEGHQHQFTRCLRLRFIANRYRRVRKGRLAACLRSILHSRLLTANGRGRHALLSEQRAARTGERVLLNIGRVP
jgi:hypothetical protein